MIRPAIPADAPAMAAVEAAAAPDPWTAGQIAGSLALPTTRGWVVDDHAIVGHLLVSAQGDEGEVLILAVHPARRRQGHASRLLDAALAWWRDQGVHRAFLEVRADNTAARALYASRGWAPAGERPDYYDDGTAALILTRDTVTPRPG